MKKVRNILRFCFCIIMLVIVVFVGYNITLKFIYPIKYSDQVQKYSSEYGIKPELVYAIIKSESDFDKDAISHANAYGLMQLTKETFNDVNIMLKEENRYNFDEQWNNAEVNIKYGTKYLQYLLNLFDDNEIAAIAAYNAGMNNVKKWFDNGTFNQENIRFKETYDYVKKVLRAEKYYKNIEKQ